MESSSLFVQHDEFIDVLLQQFQSFSFGSDRKAERHVKKRSRSDFKWRLTNGKTKANDTGEGETTQLGITQQCRRTKRSGNSNKETCANRYQCQKSDILKWVDKKKLPVYGVTPKTTWSKSNFFLQKLRATYEPSRHDQDLPDPKEENLGITANNSTFSIEAFKTNVLIWRMFMSSSMWASMRLGPNYLANLQVYNNTNFEDTESLFNITQKLKLEHSEEILNVKPVESSSPSWTRSEMSHDQAIKWTKSKSVCLLRFSSMCGTDEWKQRSNKKMRRSSGRIQDVSFLQSTIRNRWRSNWIRVEYFPRIFAIADSSRDPTRFDKKEHRTWGVHGPDHLRDNVQRHRLDKEKEWWNLHLERRKKVKDYATRFSQRHRTFLGPGSEKKWYGESSYPPNGEWDSTVNEMVQRFEESGDPVQKHQCFESWNAEKEEG